jgi:hypothetical protein
MIKMWPVLSRVQPQNAIQTLCDGPGICSGLGSRESLGAGNSLLAALR